MSAAEELPDDLELVPDDLEIVSDEHTPEKEYAAKEAQFASDRQTGTHAQRAMNALAKMKAGGKLAPDEVQALKTAMGGDFGKQGDSKMGALEAANLKGINGALLGFGDELAGGVRAAGKKLGGDKRPLGDVYTDERDTVRGAMKQADRDHPHVSMAAELAGGLPTMLALPGGAAGAAGTGMIMGAGGAETSQPLDLYGNAALGGALGLAGHAAGNVLPIVAKRAIEGAKGKAGQGLQKLAQMLGEKPIAKPQAAAAPESAIASIEEQLAEAGAANPQRAPQPRATPAAEPAPQADPNSTGALMMRELEGMDHEGMSPRVFQGYADEVNSQAVKNHPELAKLRPSGVTDDALAKLQAMFEKEGLQPKPPAPRDFSADGPATKVLKPEDGGKPAEEAASAMWDTAHRRAMPSPAASMEEQLAEAAQRGGPGGPSVPRVPRPVDMPAPRQAPPESLAASAEEQLADAAAANPMRAPEAVDTPPMPFDEPPASLKANAPDAPPWPPMDSAHDNPWYDGYNQIAIDQREVPPNPFAGSMPDDSPIMGWMERSQQKSPAQRASRKIDNAGRDLDWEALDRLTKGKIRSPEQFAADEAAGRGMPDSAVESQSKGPGPFGSKREAWNKLRETAGIDDHDSSKADAAYDAWLSRRAAADKFARNNKPVAEAGDVQVKTTRGAGAGPKPAPFEGGHFDEINQLLGLEGDQRVSGAREAFDKMTKGRKNWDEINTAIAKLKGVPGFENLRLPDEVQESIMAARDPRAGERGFIGLGDAYAGVKAVGAAGKAAAPLMNKAGAALENSAIRNMSPDAQARSLVANPSVLFQLARAGGPVGDAAKAMLQAFQAGDQTALKARAALLAAMPEFRQMFAPGRASEGPPASIAR